MHALAETDESSQNLKLPWVFQTPISIGATEIDTQQINSG